MIFFLGFLLAILNFVLLVLAVREHRKSAEDKPLDDSAWGIDFDDLCGRLRKFVSGNEEKIYAVLGIRNACNLLTKGIQEDGFCILTDKAAYFVGKVRQKKWITMFKTNIQHRIIASEMKGVNVRTLSRLTTLIYFILSVVAEMAHVRWIIGLCYYIMENGEIDVDAAILWVIVAAAVIGETVAVITGLSMSIYFMLDAFVLKRTNVCIEFSSLTVAFMVSELGRQEIKDFYKAVSKIQESGSMNPAYAGNAASIPEQSKNIYADKLTSLSELSKLYESNMVTHDEFERLKQEIMNRQ